MSNEKYSSITSAKIVHDEGKDKIVVTTEWVFPGSELHPLSLRFFELLGEVGSIHSIKQADYGSDDSPFNNISSSKDFGIPPWLASEIRANDKTNRIKAFAKKGTLENESLTDSLLDKASYSIISLVLLEDEIGKKLL